MGIEPTSSAWEAEVLPLNYTREILVYFLFWRIWVLGSKLYYCAIVTRNSIKPKSYAIMTH